jgi:hypothetical protein
LAIQSVSASDDELFDCLFVVSHHIQHFRFGLQMTSQHREREKYACFNPALIVISLTGDEV